jgi:hypothetical protein
LLLKDNLQADYIHRLISKMHKELLTTQ